VLVPDATQIWLPLSSDRDFGSDVTADSDVATGGADVLIALKPLPGSFDRALSLRRRLDLPLVLDVDDPDWERVYGERRRSVAASFLNQAARGRPPLNAYRLRWRAKSVEHLTVSNPGMHRWYGNGVVLPHARSVRPVGRDHVERPSLDVAFVGTVRPHKGMTMLREAVRQVPGATLTVTSPPPRDSLPHESWVGRTSTSEGWGLVDQCDVVVVASSPTTYGRGQLPAKLIDAMLSGRAVVTSDLPPTRWALGDAGLIVPPDDVEALAGALDSLRSAGLRSRLGARARERAMGLFSVDAVGRVLSDVVGSAVRH
jgi:glycosyltransferase involved in cell wall biosynthesis